MSLCKGLIKNLAQDQLNESAYLQLNVFNEYQEPPKTIGSKLIANTFHGKSNLKHDPYRSQKLLEELPSLIDERDGGILLDVEIDGSIESYPAWIAGKLSLMMPEAEKFILAQRLVDSS